eukprot:3625042-Pyramimonas_sp.AAC.1
MSASAGEPAFFSQAPAVRARDRGKPGCAAATNGSGPGCVTAAEKDGLQHHYHSRAFVIEDIRAACAELRARGYMCDRITHTE